MHAHLGAGAGDEAASEVAGIDLVLLEDGLLLHLLYLVIGNEGKEDVLLHCHPQSAVAIPVSDHYLCQVSTTESLLLIIFYEKNMVSNFKSVLDPGSASNTSIIIFQCAQSWCFLHQERFQ